VQARQGYRALGTGGAGLRLHDRLAVSSLVVVGRVEALRAQPPPPGALVYGGVLLHPALGEPVSRAAARPLAFYLAGRPSASRPAVHAEVWLEHEGRVLVSHHEALTADSDGEVRLAGSLPVSGLLSGAYVLRVTVTDGLDRESRTAAVTIVP
jgi:hypothetical protein